MSQYLKQLISDQFDASLCMLDECVSMCPKEHWQGPIGNSPFWRVVYHTLFFVDMYLSADEQSFSPQQFHRQNCDELGNETSTDVPYDKEVLAQYVKYCREKASETIASETRQTLETRSGFPWYPMSRGEHHLASIRHIQHHVGQLSAYLRRTTGNGPAWVGTTKE